MASVAYKNRTRDEIIAAFRESIRKKHEWQEQAEQEILKIGQERLQQTWKRTRIKLIIYINVQNHIGRTNAKFFLPIVL